VSGAVEIRPVTTRRDRKTFVKFPWRVYRGDPLWVPPLIGDRLAYLDPARGGFHAHADVALFTARTGGKTLGTIAAFVDHDRVRHTGRQEGGFGFFEALEEYEAAAALLDACRGWLRQRGMVSVRGPTNFGDNDCPGVLIAGTDFPPAMMEAHTPPYYREFLERYGMEKEDDAFAWRVTFDRVGTALDGGSSDLVRVAEAARNDASLSLRRIRLEDWDREVSLIRGLFNASLSELPGAVPLGEEDFGRSALALKPFLDPELGLIAEVAGKSVGYCLLIPDTNRVLARLNGRLFPFHWIHLKRYIREIDVVSFKLLGVLKAYRHRGIDALLYVEALRRAKARGYAWLDGSLTSEQNPAINLIARSRGAECYKHYRVYRMAIPGRCP
jgi:GNAT superfamily N-acetyltransferase